MSSTATAISVRGLCKTFRLGLRLRRVEALAGIDLQVSSGTVFGFLGPNGAGKTTTIKILTGLIHPTKGMAQVLGQPVGVSAVGMRMGYLPEQPYFYDYLNARETLTFYGQLFGLSGSLLRPRVDALLERVGLGQATDMPVRKYSKGMLQRLGIAQSLVNDPDLLILDEPMSGLDPIGRKEVRDLLLELKRAGKTVFFSSHILADIEMICDQVAIVHKGRIIEEGDVSVLLGRQGGYVEVLVKGEHGELPRLEALAGVSTEEATAPERVGDLWRYLVVAKRVDALLSDLLAAGVGIVSVSPRRATLEDLFVREIQALDASTEPPA